MWIMLNDSFISIVQKGHKDQLLVRARARGDLEKLFPGSRVMHTPDGDYAYRTWVDRTKAAGVIAARILSIGYDNFKDTVKEHDRHEAYLDVWSAMNRFQRERARGKRGGSAFRQQGTRFVSRRLPLFEDERLEDLAEEVGTACEDFDSLCRSIARDE